MSRYQSDYFEGVKRHSQVKHRVLRDHLTPWAAKVGSNPRVERLFIVDGFAGAGVYGSGELGSSGLALTFARDHQAENTRPRVACYFNDKKQTHVQSLRNLRSRLEKDSYTKLEVHESTGSFWSHVDNVVTLAGNSPVLLFVDPFGLRDLEFDGLVRLCNRLHQVDLIVNFNSFAARRLERHFPQFVDRAVGGAGWTTDSVTDVFCSRLVSACRFKSTARLPVFQDGTRRLKYELVFAARHVAAYELWNDSISKGDRTIMSVGGPELDRRLLEACDRLELAVSRRRQWSRRALREWLAVEHCGEMHSSMLNRAVTHLIDQGRWVRAAGPIDTAGLAHGKVGS